MLTSLAIKILARINLLLGLIFLKRKPRYNFSEIKSILVKRTDRIGDAVVTAPLLIELAKHFQVTVLTSGYNDFFLNKFLPTRVFTDKPLDFFAGLKLLAKNIFSVFNKKSIRLAEYDLFLDLNGLRELNVFLKIRRDNLCRYYASFNMGIWNLLFDYSGQEYPVLFSDKSLLDSCKYLVKRALGLDLNLADYMDLSGQMVSPKEFALREEFILMNISGVEKFRGPSLEIYADIVNRLSFQGKIVIMDEWGQPHFKDFRKYVKRNNLVFLCRDFSVWELLSIAAKSLAYVGSDSGITNLLQVPTHAVLFYGTGIPRAWRPFSKNPYNKKKIGKLTIEQTITSKNLKKKIIYSPLWCRPCFDIGCKRRICLAAFQAEVVAKEIEELIRK